MCEVDTDKRTCIHFVSPKESIGIYTPERAIVDCYRLNRMPHAHDFVLKSGILLGAYSVRRSTKDADSNAITTEVTPENIASIVRDVAAVEIEDGVEFRLDTLTVREIREVRRPDTSRVELFLPERGKSVDDAFPISPFS